MRHAGSVTSDPWTTADPYEPFMGRWSRQLAADVVSWLAPPPGARWLDVGCGTGAASAAVLGSAAPSSLVGVDPSAAYVEAASEQLANPRATFRVGSADSLPVPDSSVDEVISGLVLNFVPDPVAAIGEMRRALVSGGRVTAYVWDYADGMKMLRHFWDAVSTHDPAAAGLDEGVRFPLCLPGALERCFVGAGLVEVGGQPVEIETAFDDFEDYWRPFLGGQGPAPGYCASLSTSDLDTLRELLRATLPTEDDGSIRLPARAWAVTGRSA
jgi:SAM-dependent methyltransferase